MSAPIRTVTRLKHLRVLLSRSVYSGKKKIKYTNLFSVKNETCFEAYRTLIQKRCSEADCSLLVEFKDEDYVYDVLSAVQHKFGTIKTGFRFYGDSGRNLVLIEFTSSKYLSGLASNRVKYFSDMKKRGQGEPDLMSRIKECRPKTLQLDKLNNCSSVSDQIMCLYREMQMSEAMLRLHFFVGMLVSRIVRFKYADAELKFLGSSSCGLALEGQSDLDMVTLLDDSSQEAGFLKHTTRQLYKADMLFKSVFHIRLARVPIIKFNQIHTGMSCDLSSNNITGVLMAEMLYWLHVYEPLFYPLVMALKVWSNMQHVTSSGMGHHLSNHMLTMLVIAYMQQIEYLPALKTLYENTDKTTKSMGMLSMWKTTKLKKHKHSVGKLYKEDKGLGELLLGFFQFYSKFPHFRKYVIDVLHGKVVEMPHKYAICVMNPHEADHNICKNVDGLQLDRFRRFCTQSAKTLELNEKKCAGTSAWGLTCILSKKMKTRGMFNIDLVYDSDNSDLEKVVIEIDSDDVG